MLTEDVVELVNRLYLIHLGKYFKIFLSSTEQRSVNLQEIVLNKKANLGHQDQTNNKQKPKNEPLQKFQTFMVSFVKDSAKSQA